MDPSAISGEPSTAAEADTILLEIQGRKGHLSESLREWLGHHAPPKYRNEINNKFEAVRKDAAKYLKSTTSLNSSNTHFIDELIQNADDASYLRASARGNLPWIKFRILQNSIIVETNEDGFSRADVEAICEAGESSKTKSIFNHIGEKGIGFKSLFRVAEEVHIASGLWHFYFRYTGQGDESGMVTPLLKDPVTLNNGTGTRLTINLNAEHRNNIQRIITGFEDLSDTAIFFLRNIRNLEISLELQVLRKTRSIQMHGAVSRGRVRLSTTKSQTLPGPVIPETRTEKYFEVYTDTLQDMPQDSRRSFRSANVTLAFPIDASNTVLRPVARTFLEPGLGTANTSFVPTYENESNGKVNRYQSINFQQPYQKFSFEELRLADYNAKLASSYLHAKVAEQPVALLDRRGEHVFAFLPVFRSVQINFLIQSDFITTPNRESIEQCNWNERLVSAVADTFCNAVAHFCNAGLLQYEWPKFVPSQPIDGHFSTLQKRIIDGLQSKSVFCTPRSRTLRRPRDLRRIPRDFKHDGLPLLADNVGLTEIYLAPQFDAYTTLLDQLGVRYLDWDQILDRLAVDLSMIFGCSRTKSGSTSKAWHEALSSLLLQIYSQPALQKYKQRLEDMAIIPLVSGQWSLAPAGKPSRPQLHFSTIDGVQVPLGLGLSLVDAKITASPERQKLASKMGVQYCTTVDAGRRIFKLHQGFVPPKTIEEAVDQLYFCYRFNIQFPIDHWDFWVYTSNGNAVKSRNELYLPNKSFYSVDQLSQLIISRNPENAKLCGDWLLHSSYLRDRLLDRPGAGPGWQDWLLQKVGIAIVPRLTRPSTFGSPQLLSGALKTILTASSELFLDVLQAHWSDVYASTFLAPTFSKDLLLHCLVKCQDGREHPLGKAYLPNQEIINRAEELGVAHNSKILSLSGSGKDFTLGKWTSLRDLNLRAEADVDFHLQALHAMQGQNEGNGANLAYAYVGAHAQRKQKESLITEFATHRLLYVPPTAGDGNRWFSSRECVWQGPQCLNVKKSLAALYQHDKDTTDLFTSVLEIPNAAWQDLVDQLKVDKQSSRTTFEEVDASKIYLELKSMNQVNWEQLRSAFSTDRLVYASGAWYDRNDCLWASELEIEGRPILSRIENYRVLEDFFTKDLRVRKASVDQFITQLIKMADKPNSLDVETAKKFLVQISGMLPPHFESTSPLDSLLDDLAKSNVLPVRTRDEHPRLVSGSSEFAIRDHHEFSRIFATSCTFLDFSFDEVPQVRRLIEALNLEGNGVSHLVEQCPGSKEGAIVDNELTALFQRKAPCLFSCAYKYGSRRAGKSDRSLLDELLTIRVYTCSKITTQLTLDLEDVEPVQFSDATQMLLEADNGSLSLYVPRLAKAQRLVLRHHLPTSILSLMFPNESPEEIDERAKTAIASILTSPLSDMDDVMKIENLPRVPWLHENDYDFGSDTASVESEEETFSVPIVSTRAQEDIQSSPISSPDPESDTLIDSDIDEAERGHDDARLEAHTDDNRARYQSSEVALRSAFAGISISRQNLTRAGIGGSSNGPSASVATAAAGSYAYPGYLSLLKQVINCAARRRVSRLVENDQPVSLSMSDVFGSESRSRGNREQNNMVGAAGELFVFELLKGLGLPNFGTNDWQSQCRNYVRVHPSYAGMQSWHERETADIVYKDVSGELGKWLSISSCNGFPSFDKGVSPQNSLRCTYLIEVKTTTDGSCDTDFHMSGSGYRLMNRCKLDPARTPEQIYVIVRVFDLLTENVGFKVFVDPTRSRNDMDVPPSPALRFRGDSWLVRPYTSTTPAL